MLKANSYVVCSFLPHHQNSIVSQYLLLSVDEIFSTGLYFCSKELKNWKKSERKKKERNHFLRGQYNRYVYMYI